MSDSPGPVDPPKQEDPGTPPPFPPRADQTPHPAPYDAVPPPQAYGYPQAPPQHFYGHAPGSAPRPTSGMYVAAAILNWVTMAFIILGTFGFGIFVAAWFVPMTIFIHKGAKDPYKHTALAVCTLLFCNVIGGILMLVDNGKRVDRPIG